MMVSLLRLSKRIKDKLNVRPRIMISLSPKFFFFFLRNTIPIQPAFYGEKDGDLLYPDSWYFFKRSLGAPE